MRVDSHTSQALCVVEMGSVRDMQSELVATLHSTHTTLLNCTVAELASYSENADSPYQPAERLNPITIG